MNYRTVLAKNQCLQIEHDNSFTLLEKCRAYLFNRFGIWDIWDVFPYQFRMYYYDFIKPIFNPHHKRIRKVVPRKWSDISSLIVDVNFEFIKAFYEDEFTAGIVDWDATEHHKEFADWLTKAYRYITVERPILESRRDQAYPPFRKFSEMFESVKDQNGNTTLKLKDDKIPCETKYREVNKLEAKIDKTDIKILTELVKRKDYFWT